MQILLLLLGFVVFPMVYTFECYTCNTDSTRAGPCIDRKTSCSGSESCSMAVMFDGETSVVRKFCTPPTTPIYQYLMMIPGASMCQNVDMNYSTHRRHRRYASRLPPAGPNEQSSLLCVCTTPLCNQGTYVKVLENTMLNNLPRRLLPDAPEAPEEIQMQLIDQNIEKDNHKIEIDESDESDESDMIEQMANAGF